QPLEPSQRPRRAEDPPEGHRLDRRARDQEGRRDHDRLPRERDRPRGLVPRAMTAFIHPTAEVESGATVGAGTRVWRSAQIRKGARVGRECNIGKDAFIDLDVVVGDRCKIENGAYLFKGSRLAEGVFIGPGAILTNDRLPRAINQDGSLKSAEDWTESGVTV